MYIVLLFKFERHLCKVSMVLGDAGRQLETFVWILNHVSRSITSFDQFYPDLSCGGVRLSIM